MNPEKILKAASSVRAAYERDRRARYGLLKPLTLPRVRCRAVGVEPFAWDGPYIAVRPGADGETVTITVKPYPAISGVCDGCSLSTDLHGCIEAALFHDPWYVDMDAMSTDTGIPLADLRRLGDAVFGALCRAYGAPSIVARVYYNTVRWLGGLYHRAKPHLPVAVIGATLAALTLAGCAGCAVPDILDGDPDAPVWEGPTNAD